MSIQIHRVYVIKIETGCNNYYAMYVDGNLFTQGSNLYPSEFIQVMNKYSNFDDCVFKVLGNDYVVQWFCGRFYFPSKLSDIPIECFI